MPEHICRGHRKTVESVLSSTFTRALRLEHELPARPASLSAEPFYQLYFRAFIHQSIHQ